jgi:guanylate kinase
MTVVPPANISAHMATELDGRSSSVFLVLSGPGGTGKSTLIRMWRKDDPDIGYVKNVTTRARRPPDPSSGVNDDDFFDFVSRDQFRELVRQDKLAQWVNPQEGYYSGTPRQPLLEAIEQRRDLVFDYTPQLYLNLQRAFNMGVQDMSYVDMHHYHVTNHDLEETLETLRSILRAEKQRLTRFPELCDLYDTMKDRRQMLFYYDPAGSRIDGI